MHMAAYDWRLAFQNTEVRDRTLSRLKSSIELLVQTNGGKKVVVIPHSMGSLYFLHFMKWVEAPPPMGGGGGSDWCAKHIKAMMNIGGPFLGVPKAVTGLFSTEAKDIAMARAVIPDIMDQDIAGMQPLQHIMQVTRTWDSTISMLLKGGKTIWGGLDWSPEEGYDCFTRQKKRNVEENVINNPQSSDVKDLGRHGRPLAHYGRIISFGKNAAEMHAMKIKSGPLPAQRSGDDLVCRNVTCGTAWTEYHEMSWKSVEAVAEQVYTADMIPDLLRFVAPQMMQRGDAHYSHGIAEDFSDPKYKHFKYWSNALETQLPNAPDMEIYCMYGVGILTERSYIYKISPYTETGHIPFRIDTSADGDSEGCLKGGVQFVDGDETVPVLSGGFMCAKGWRGKTRFNPAGAAAFVREYEHVSPNSFLEGRGTQSASHVDIMGNFALIQDVLKVAAGQEVGGDRILSDLLKWADQINLPL
ncbi:hypothetical protein L7F22_050603 [Adiantum nelumboides]|nr:hypothetical protein [Adiantum nelumboides]